MAAQVVKRQHMRRSGKTGGEVARQAVKWQGPSSVMAQATLLFNCFYFKLGHGMFVYLSLFVPMFVHMYMPQPCISARD